MSLSCCKNRFGFQGRRRRVGGREGEGERGRRRGEKEQMDVVCMLPRWIRVSVMHNIQRIISAESHNANIKAQVGNFQRQPKSEMLNTNPSQKRSTNNTTFRAPTQMNDHPGSLFTTRHLQGYLAHKKPPPVEPYRRPMPRVLGGSGGFGGVL